MNHNAHNDHNNALQNTGSYQYERAILDADRRKSLTHSKKIDSLGNEEEKHYDGSRDKVISVDKVDAKLHEDKQS